MKKIILANNEDERIYRIVKAGRKLEDWLWGDLNGEWGLEEWKRMITKRAHKIVKVNTDNPHWKIELKKRLLQNACVSIALMGRLDNLEDGIHPTVPSNLPEYDKIVKKCENKP